MARAWRFVGRVDFLHRRSPFPVGILPWRQQWPGNAAISFPVGGPLASLRAEAAGLDRLLDLVALDQPLLIFTDCLTMLMILLRWGRLDFWPDPEDIKHFDVLGSCLRKLRCRSGPTRLVKVKSHSGLLMNERADALAEHGRLSEEPPLWPGPRKLDPLFLKVRPGV